MADAVFYAPAISFLYHTCKRRNTAHEKSVVPSPRPGACPDARVVRVRGRGGGRVRQGVYRGDPEPCEQRDRHLELQRVRGRLGHVHRPGGRLSDPARPAGRVRLRARRVCHRHRHRRRRRGRRDGGYLRRGRERHARHRLRRLGHEHERPGLHRRDRPGHPEHRRGRLRLLLEQDRLHHLREGGVHQRRLRQPGQAGFRHERGRLRHLRRRRAELPRRPEGRGPVREVQHPARQPARQRGLFRIHRRLRRRGARGDVRGHVEQPRLLRL